MILQKLTEKDKVFYNQFISQSHFGSFLQSWEWGMWQEKLGRKVDRFKILDGVGEWIGAVQLVLMPLPLGKFYCYAPYGPILDLKFKNEDLRLLLQEIKNVYPHAVFFRLEPKQGMEVLEQEGRKTLNIQPAKTLVLDLRQSAEELYAHMHHKTRYNIRLSQKHGVEVNAELAVVPGHGLYMQEAIKLIVQTAGRQSFQTFPSSYYENLLDFFAVHNPDCDLKIYIYRALHMRQLLAAAIMIDFGGTRTYLFGGSIQQHREVMAPYALHAWAIEDAQKVGLFAYDFWGIETAKGDTPGFVRFKMGFGGSELKYAGAYDIPNKPIFYHGYKMVRWVHRLVREIRKNGDL